jgi:hypothetical protein
MTLAPLADRRPPVRLPGPGFLVRHGHWLTGRPLVPVEDLADIAA